MVNKQPLAQTALSDSDEQFRAEPFEAWVDRHFLPPATHRVSAPPRGA